MFWAYWGNSLKIALIFMKCPETKVGETTKSGENG